MVNTTGPNEPYYQWQAFCGHSVTVVGQNNTC